MEDGCLKSSRTAWPVPETGTCTGVSPTCRTTGPKSAGMSKARLVITAVTIEKRSVGEVARTCEIARSWVCALLARYRAEGEAAFEPRSRRPRTSPAAISQDTAAVIIRLRKELAGQGLDAGSHTV